MRCVVARAGARRPVIWYSFYSGEMARLYHSLYACRHEGTSLAPNGILPMRTSPAQSKYHVREKLWASAG